MLLHNYVTRFSVGDHKFVQNDEKVVQFKVFDELVFCFKALQMIRAVSEDGHFPDVLEGVFMDKFHNFLHVVGLQEVSAHLL